MVKGIPQWMQQPHWSIFMIFSEEILESIHNPIVSKCMPAKKLTKNPTKFSPTKNLLFPEPCVCGDQVVAGHLSECWLLLRSC